MSYDPAFAYEVAVIVKDGLRRMYGEAPENVFYYLTVYNEPKPQPAKPESLDVDGLLRGPSDLALSCSSRTQKQKGSQRAIGIANPEVGHHHRSNHGFDRPVLADDFLL